MEFNIYKITGDKSYVAYLSLSKRASYRARLNKPIQVSYGQIIQTKLSSPQQILGILCLSNDV